MVERGENMSLAKYVQLIQKELLPNIHLTSKSPYDPIIVRNGSGSWKTVGTGNYAAVFLHEEYPGWVVKVYGRNKEELIKEIEVYKKLGEHRSYSTLYAYGEEYLVLKKLEGITLFNALVKGVPIPETVIQDVDEGLDYARLAGLNPYDVHGKNVVMNKGKGYIVDVSDFYKEGHCYKWEDLKKVYFRIYLPFICKHHPPIPLFVMNWIRKGYRLYRKKKRRTG